MSNGKLINKNGWAESFLSWEKNNSTGNDLMWEKLNQKLQAPRKKKSMNLLWAAAARNCARLASAFRSVLSASSNFCLLT